MAINTQTIRIDLNPGKTIPVAFVHQNDTNRQLTFQLYNNGEAFTPSSTTVKFAYKSPIVNGRYSVITGSQMASGTVSGNTVTVTLPAQYTQVSGVGLLTMILTTSGNTLRPVNIKFVCQGSADGDDTVLGASDWPEGLYDYMDNWLEENEPTEIANLKSDLNIIQNDIDDGTKTFFYDIVENSYPNASGGFDTYNGWDRTDYIFVEGGSTVYINNPSKATNDNAFYRADKSIISRFSIPIKTPYALDIPSDCAYIVVSNNRANFFTKIYTLSAISEIKADAEKALSEVDNIESNALTRRTSRQIFDRSKAESGYIILNGNVYPDSNTYDYYQFIYVGDHTGDTLHFSADGVAYSTRFVCAYDADKNALEAKGAQSVASYTVPDGVVYISLSWAKNAHYQAEWDRITPTSTWFDSLETKTNTAISTVCFGGMVTKTSGDLAGGESLTLESTCSKKNNVFAFYGKISAFTGIRIGQGLGYSRGHNIHVTPTGISWQKGTADGNPISHGLTFVDYICVVIDVDNDGYGHVTLFTNGGTYKRDTTPWLGSDSNIFVTADSGTSLTECDFSFTLKDIKKHVWYFGDSYISNSESRWVHYINQLGYYKNLYMDGFSGANSAQIYPDVERLLNNGVAPRYLVWGLGMNDADDAAVNSSWLAYYTLLRDLCDQKGVQLILCTIPNTPSVNNIYKNEIVKNSGLPYIDYASAVNTGVNDSAWYSGMLSSDNVHPTAEGARALASKLINDFPIISES